MSGTVQNHHHEFLDTLAQNFGNAWQYFLQRVVNSKLVKPLLHRLRHCRAKRQFFRIKCRQVLHRPILIIAPLACRHHRDGMRQSISKIRRAIHRVECDIESGCIRFPITQLVTKKNTRRIVLNTFANDDFAPDVHQVKDAVDCIASGRVGQLLFATPEPL